MIRILLFLFISLPLAVIGQGKRTFDTSFVNNSSNDFFCRNPAVDRIVVYDGSIQSKTLSVYLKSFRQDSTIKENGLKNHEYFDLDFLGDKYLFDKKYGDIRFPEKEMEIVMEIVRAQSCNLSCAVRVIAKADSLKCIVECYCPTKNDEDRIFTKIERGPKYKNGLKHLQTIIETAFTKKNLETQKQVIDSALIFKILVDRKDSCLQSIEIIEGKYSSFAQLVIDELKSACSWTPLEQGGWAVMAYYRIFVRLNKDKSITMAVPGW